MLVLIAVYINLKHLNEVTSSHIDTMIDYFMVSISPV